MSEKLLKRANALLNYLEDIIRLGNKVIYNIDDHDDFKLYQNQLIDVENIILDEDEAMIMPTVINIERPNIPSAPEPDEYLKQWLIYQDEYDKPDIADEEVIHNYIEEKKEEEDYDGYSNTQEVLVAYEKYVEEWEKWYQKILPLKKVQNLYKDLFQVRKKLQYEEDLELVLGYGIIIWKHNDYTIKYPIVTHNMVVTHNPEKNVIQVTPPDDAEWQLEIEQINETVDQNLSNIRKAFDNANSKGEENQFRDLLYEVKGLAPDAELSSIDALDSYSANHQLKIIDGWVLFARKKNQNELLKDVSSFKEQINENESPFTPIIEKILDDPNNYSITYDDNDFHDEWDSFLDQEILFPKETNEEQIRILDYLKKSDGVVVQGPPGTGKSHTIANLISHFIAHGQRVLVTSQKEQALKVLNKMLPPSLRSLCISILSNDKNRSKKLERAVSQITNVVTNMSLHRLKQERENLNSKFDVRKARLEKIKRELYFLSKKGMPVLMSNLNEPLTPAEGQRYINNNQEEYNWFKDFPPYEKEQSTVDNEDVIILKADTNFNEDEIAELKKLRKELEPYFKDFVEYKLPESKSLVGPAKFKNMADNLFKIALLEEEVNNYYKDLKVNYDLSLLDNTINNLEKGVKIKTNITNSWALDFINKNQDIKQKLKQSLNELEIIYQKISELNDKLSLTTKIDLDNKFDYSDYQVFVEDAYDRVKSGKKPWKLLSLFDNGKKAALKKVKLNGSVPNGEEDWKKVLLHIKMQIKLNDFKSSWEGFIVNFPGFQIPDLKEASHQEIKANFSCLQDSFYYIFELRPSIINCINELLIGDKSSIIKKLYNEIENLLKALKLKKEQWEIKESESLYKRMKDKLKTIKLMDGHPLVNEFLSCLANDYSKVKEKASAWDVAYKKLVNLENYLPKFNKYEKIVGKIRKQAPRWAEDLMKAYDVNRLHFSNWREAWNFNILKKYLIDINKSENKIAEYEEQLKRYQSDIKTLKEDLVLVNTRINLIKNITQSSLASLKKWKMAMSKYGSGYGKYAPRYRKNAQQYMRSARNAVPAWIMPVHMVSETTSKVMGAFDVVIVDEASQCDIRSLLVLFRAKKVIIVGDDKQISPSAVGIKYDIVFNFINQHLSDFPHGQLFDLTTSLYDLAQLFFTSQTLMLKEHFRCLPEIIEFSNQNFYQGEILPLRDVPDSQKLSPVLETVFVSEGYRKDKINKPEAEAICSRIKEMTKDPKYRGKTIGVISLTGYEQAKYIFNKIDDYITPSEQEEIKFHVGDAYAFQGDERDIIILSMVVGGEDDRFRALSSKGNKQRFNVATSRAKDKLILFHSVELGKDLNNPKDLRYQLLNYMKNGLESEKAIENKKEKCDSVFEEDVFDYLTRRGYKVTPQVRVGNFKIDLVVEGEKNKLAVECDGDKWHPPSKWWDDKMRQRQLERAGWIFWRISGTNFYRDKEGSMESLISRLEELNIYPEVNHQEKETSEDKAIKKTSSETEDKLSIKVNQELLSSEGNENKRQPLFDGNLEEKDISKEDKQNSEKLEKEEREIAQDTTIVNANQENKNDNKKQKEEHSNSNINKNQTDDNSNFSLYDVVEDRDGKRGKVIKINDDKLLVSIGKEGTENWLKSECTFIREGKPIKGKSIKSNNKNNYKKMIVEELQRQNNKKCPDCNEGMEIRISKYGAFWGCKNYPKCKATENFNQKIVREIVEELNITCPKDDCNGQLRFINTRKSTFLGCSNYPDCDFIKFL